MAIKLENKTNVYPPDAQYPFGDIKDESTSGANDGTPVDRAVYADFHQFFEKMMFESGIVHNNLPDSETDGFQLYDSLIRVIGQASGSLRRFGGFNTLLTDIIPQGGNNYDERFVYVSDNFFFLVRTDLINVDQFDFDGNILQTFTSPAAGVIGGIWWDEATEKLYVSRTSLLGPTGYYVFDSDTTLNNTLSNPIITPVPGVSLNKIWTTEDEVVCFLTSDAPETGIRKYDKAGTTLNYNVTIGAFNDMFGVVPSSNENVVYYQRSNAVVYAFLMEEEALQTLSTANGRITFYDSSHLFSKDDISNTFRRSDTNGYPILDLDDSTKTMFPDPIGGLFIRGDIMYAVTDNGGTINIKRVERDFVRQNASY